MAQKQALGKGLAALISAGEMKNENSAYNPEFDISLISPNPYQPRMQFSPEDLKEIADSIKEHGIIQPLVITENPDQKGSYYIIAGERRYRAAQLLGLKTVPVVVKDSSPQQMLELALIENIQREDLNPLEEALAFTQLQDEFGMTQTEIAKKMGLNRVTVTNKMRLLKLPEQVREAVLNGRLSEGHARALLGITDQTSLIAAANIVIKRQLSVRDTEDMVRKINFSTKRSSSKKFIDYERTTKEIADRLSKKLGFTVRFKKMAKGGKMIVRYNSDKELKELTEKILK